MSFYQNCSYQHLYQTIPVYSAHRKRNPSTFLKLISSSVFSDLVLSIVFSLKYLTSSSYLTPPKTLKHAPGPTSLEMKQNKNKSKTPLNYKFFSNHSPLLFTAQLHKCSFLQPMPVTNYLLFTKCKKTLSIPCLI